LLKKLGEIIKTKNDETWKELYENVHGQAAK
jgi:hypothetical protein